MKLNITQIPSIIITTEDRKYILNRTLEELIPKFNPSIFYGIQHKNPIIGCVLSHCCVMYNLHQFPILVMEDDISIESNNFKEIYEAPDDSDALYVGTSLWGWRSGTGGLGNIRVNSVQNEDFLKVENMLSAHAIVYTNPNYLNGIKKEFSRYTATECFDIHMADIQHLYKVYALKYPLVYQRNSNEYSTRTSISEYFNVK